MAVGNTGNRRPQRFGQIPVKEGEIYDVQIEGIGEKGDGIAKVNGYVIIVPNVKKGENVKVKINAVRGKVSFGEVVGKGEMQESENEQEMEENEEMDESEDDEEESEEDSQDEEE